MVHATQAEEEEVQSFEQLYQMLLHVTGFTHCAWIFCVCVLDIFAYISIVLYYISMHVVR